MATMHPSYVRAAVANDGDLPDLVNRGVAVWKGKVFVTSVDGVFHALDAKTGNQLWSAPTITDHTDHGAVRGYVSAYVVPRRQDRFAGGALGRDASMPARWRGGHGTSRAARPIAGLDAGDRAARPNSERGTLDRKARLIRTTPPATAEGV